MTKADDGAVAESTRGSIGATHCSAVADLHSVTLTEDLQELQVWLELLDGSLITTTLPVRELLARGHMLGTADPRH